MLRNLPSQSANSLTSWRSSAKRAPRLISNPWFSISLSAEAVAGRIPLPTIRPVVCNASAPSKRLDRTGRHRALVGAASGIGFEDGSHLVAHLAKYFHLLLFCATGLSWIEERPVVPVHLPGKNGTGLVGIAANGDDSFDRLLQEFREMLRRVL